MAGMDEHETERDGATLVLGGTGRTGRRVVARLRARGVHTRVGSRSGEPPVDWQDRSTWPAVLDGVAAVYVAYSPDLAVPGAAEAVGELTALAAGRGVRRVVLLSGRGEAEARRAEDAVRTAATAAGAEWTVVRASWFAQGFSESFLLDGVRAGTVALPVDGVGEPFVDADDIADVAVAALTGPGHAGRVHEVTGPRLLTFAEAVDEIARATGRPVRFESVPLERWAAGMGRAGLPGDVVDLMSYLFGEVLDGRNASVTDGVRSALGRAPRDFSAYARATAATGVWGTAR